MSPFRLNKTAGFGLKTGKTLLAVATAAALLPNASLAQNQATALEEVIITAQKREESLQDAPIAVAAMNQAQLEVQGLASMTDFQAGAIPTLKIAPFPNSPSTQVVFIRGVGNSDMEQVTRDQGVGTYLDGIYLGRAQGMAMELADLERIEVLRGPQGTLYGRNALGGAVSMVTAKPTGELEVNQKFTVGNYNHFKSVTNVNLPELAGISTKLSYLTSEKDGWVDNTADGEADYNERDNEGFRVALRWQAGDSVTVDYSYDDSETKASQLYYQIESSTVPPKQWFIDSGFATLQFLHGLPAEGSDRVDETRFDIYPLGLNTSEVEGHTLNISWNVNDNLEVRSITGHREMDVFTDNNYGGSVSTGGLVATGPTSQEQLSQEFQFLGDALEGRLTYVAGIYYFEEEADYALSNSSSYPYELNTGIWPLGAVRNVDAEAESIAVFGQTTWTPAGLENLDITLGIRYTEDEKEGVREQGGVVSNFELDSDNVSPTVTFDYTWSENLSSYVRWANGYRSGGANFRSAASNYPEGTPADFWPAYEEETMETWEIGVKSELFDRKVRINAAAFLSDYEDRQLDFSAPNDITSAETINAEDVIEVSGFELDMTALLTDGLVAGVQYVYMDYDVPLLTNPLSGEKEEFALAMTPRHSGSVSLDYTFNPTGIGTFSTNLTYNFSDEYWFSAQNFDIGSGGFELFNARISLDIATDSDHQILVSAWGKNLTDDEWITHGISAGNGFGTTVSKAYGEPRTYGMDIQFIF